MNKEVTFGHVMALLSILVIPLIIWGVNVETRLERNKMDREDIKYLKENQSRTYEVIHNNQLELMNELGEIRVELKDKENRKN